MCLKVTRLCTTLSLICVLLTPLTTVISLVVLKKTHLFMKSGQDLADTKMPLLSAPKLIPPRLFGSLTGLCLLPQKICTGEGWDECSHEMTAITRWRSSFNLEYNTLNDDILPLLQLTVTGLEGSVCLRFWSPKFICDTWWNGSFLSPGNKIC